jgi:hypothetical protein
VPGADLDALLSGPVAGLAGFADLDARLALHRPTVATSEG